jgi:hypothetical protein
LTDDFVRLDQLVKDITIWETSNGGTTPELTCDAIREDAPDLFVRFGRECIIALAKEFQSAELPTESARLQVAFENLNRQFFGGTLPHFIICVVVDVACWDGRKGGECDSGAVDFERQLITIGYTGDNTEERFLLLHMARAAHPEGSFWDEILRAEIRRLLALGAPLEFLQPKD